MHPPSWSRRGRLIAGLMLMVLGGTPALAFPMMSDSARPEPADRILRAGRIWTGNPAQPWAEAIALRDGEIVAVGTAAEIDAWQGPDTRRDDWPEAFVTPGLIDAHGHMPMLGETVELIDLRGVSSVEAVAERVAARVAAEPGDGWIKGRNWDQSLWPDMEFPTAAALDAVASDRPVWLVRVDGHAGWANSEALRRAGITESTPAPDGGAIHVDADGRPTGVLIDEAMGLVARVVPPATRDDIARRLLAAQTLALAAGLTGVHDAGLSPTQIDIYRELDRTGRLKIRVYGMASPPDGREAAFASISPLEAPVSRRFTLRAIKLFMDGAMGSRGALLFEPYDDDPHNHGLQLIDADVLRETTIQALRNGWQVCTHAIGDKGNALVLDAYEAALAAVPEATDARLRIEHAQVVRRADVGRFQRLGVIASMQPSHAATDKRWADLRLGANSERANGAYAWSWFRDEGVALAFGSDFPVEIVDPRWGLYAAITRRGEDGEPPGGWHPEHRLNLDDTLRAFTAGAAHAGFAEDRVGTLRPGMRADMTVFDRDLFEATPESLRDARVLHTIVDGEDVL